jgi:hypothetical protein
MDYFSSLLFVVFTWLLPSPEPTVLMPLSSGIFQEYGFEQNDSERFAPILKLLYDGAYRVKEVDDESKTDTAVYSIYAEGDSVILEKQAIYQNTLNSNKDTEIFTKKGKLLYSSSLSRKSYYIPDGTFVEYIHIRPKRYNNGVDSTILLSRTTYDILGRPLEHDHFDQYEEFMDYGKISSKTIYHYTKNGHEIEKLSFQRVLLKRPWPSAGRTQDSIGQAQYKTDYEEYKNRKLFGPVEYALYRRELKKIDSSARSIETEMFDYNNGDPDEYKWTNSIIDYDSNWHPLVENNKVKFTPSSEIYRNRIDHIRNADGLLISKLYQASDDSPSETDAWTYDNFKNCTSHGHGKKTLETWKYDFKGNLVEFTYGAGKNRFMIFYK